MERYGLLGYPLGHSFSVQYFTRKFEKERLDAVYQNYEYADLNTAIEVLKSEPFLRGFNVTIPYKLDIVPFLDSISRDAEIIGAVNVVRVTRSDDNRVKLKGYNSDVLGFVASIRPLLIPEIHKKALVLGTGGASHAVIYGLRKMGLDVLCVSRNPQLGQIAYADVTPALMKDYSVIVNCTPVGMFPHVDECPDIPYEALTPKHLLYDLVYNPIVTKFLQKGLEQGAKTKNGLEMLHLQADAAWRIWQEKE